MKILYEKKTDDFNYRNDRGRNSPLSCPAHMHYHVELIYMKNGETRAFIDTDEYTLHSGELLVVFPNQVHRFEDIKPGPEYELFIINPDLAPEISASFANQEPENAIIKDIEQNQRVILLIKILADAFHFPQASREILMHGYMLSFFGELLEMMTFKSAKSEESRAIRSIVKFCSKNFKRDISLSLLEENLHLSKYYISHLFSDKLGISFTDYVNFLRVSEACRMLRIGDSSITEIAYSVGFGTLRTFNRAFMKQLGCPPSEYRKNNRGDILEVSIPRGK